MANDKYIGTFESETEVLKKIEELKTKGYKENDIFVATSNEGEISMVRGRTNVDSKVVGKGMIGNFLGFLKGNEPMQKAFSEMGFDKNETKRYLRAVKNGEIVLVADQKFGASYINKGFNSAAAYGDPKDQTGHMASADFNTANRNVQREHNDSEESADAILSTGPSSKQGLMPNDELTDTANTGRNRKGVPMMDRKVEDVPANDPNVPDMGAPEKRTDNIREVDAHTIDIDDSKNALSDMPTTDTNKTDIPSAEEKTPDVPTGNQGINRSLDTDSPGDLSQTARDKNRLGEDDQGDNRSTAPRK